jgi:hypothetical protein
MATTLEELVVKISADVADLSSGMQQGLASVSDSTSKMEKAITQFTEGSSNSLMNFSNVAETALGVFGGAAILEGVKKLGEFVKEAFEELVVESVKAAEAQEDAINRLNVALASAGQYSRETSHDFQEYAHALQQTTVYSEESVMQAGALIESLGKLDKEGLERATNAAVNLAATLRIDLNTAAMMVGKAAEGNISVFQRYGMAVEQGSTASETFANVLKTIEANGNVAAAQANTYAGALTQLQHTSEDSHKALGELVVKNQAVIESIKEVTAIFSENTEEGKKNAQAYRELVAEGLIVLIEAVNVLVVSLDAAMRIGEAAFEVMMLPLKELIAGIVAAQQALKGDFAGAWDSLKANATGALKDVGNAFTQDSKLGELSTMLARVEGAAQKGFEAVKSGASSTIDPINGAKKALEAFTAEQLKMGDEGAKIWKQFQDQDPKAKYLNDLQALRFAHDQEKISDQEYYRAAKLESDKFREALAQERQTEITDLMAKNKALETIDKVHNQGQIAENKKRIAELMKEEDQGSKFVLETKAKQAKEEAAIEKERIDAGKTALNDLAVFQNSKNSEMAAVGKAAAIASATISTYEGATKAYTSLAGIPIIGPELGFVAAAAAVAAGMARVASIEGTQLASGIDSVPGIGNEDNFKAVLAPGERVVPQETNKDLKEFLAMALGKGGGGGSQGEGGSVKIELSLKDELVKFVEAKIIERQRIGVSLLPKLA